MVKNNRFPLRGLFKGARQKDASCNVDASKRAAHDSSCAYDASYAPNDSSCTRDASFNGDASKRAGHDSSCAYDASYAPNDSSCAYDASYAPNDLSCTRDASCNGDASKCAAHDSSCAYDASYAAQASSCTHDASFNVDASSFDAANNKPILSVKNVSRVFAPDVHALRGVSFDVFKGDFIVMAGANGSGKSVLMSLIAGLDAPSEGSIERSPTLQTGIVFQDADSQILGETVFEDAAFGARQRGLRGSELSARVDEVLLRCGLSAKKDFSARVLSGGEKRRLSVAGVLAMKTDLILFDEPFANLDYPSVKSVCALLRMLKQNGTAIIVLTHELEKILGLANRFIVLDSGLIRFDGKPNSGLQRELSQWGIRNPLELYGSAEKMIWD